jgi:hypothetical protein
MISWRIVQIDAQMLHFQRVLHACCQGRILLWCTTGIVWSAQIMYAVVLAAEYSRDIIFRF